MREREKIFLLYNWVCDESHWIPQKLKKRGYNVEIVDLSHKSVQQRGSKFFRLLNIFSSFKISFNCIKRAREKDIIISMTSTPGITSALILNILKRKYKIKIIALNLLAHWGSSNHMIEKIRDLFYMIAFKYPYLWSTVNVKTDINLYSKNFCVDKERFFLLPDAIENMKSIKMSQSKEEYIFAGGMSERDWDCIVKCAIQLKKYKFVVVANKHDWSDKYPQLDNLQVYHNITLKEFNKLLYDSKVVVLPLKSEGTAGLMVLFEALRNKKMVIATETEAIKNFISPQHRSNVLYQIHNDKMLSEQIDTVYKMNKEQYEYCVNGLIEYIYNNYSEEIYLNRVEEMIKDISSVL